MCADEKRDSAFVQTPEVFPEGSTKRRVDSRGGFVEDKQFWVVDERDSEG